MTGSRTRITVGKERTTFKLGGRRGRGRKILIFCSLEVLGPETMSLRNKKTLIFFKMPFSKAFVIIIYPIYLC